ncbi:tetratricopeptide repeat protein [Methylophilus aquaticus]|uniref:Tetratricopeptide repeat protein n=1 Tax=Methylophilus aquaticus TaxID=1971610 RepID=A0ABT9JRB7_9PROT|nr:tetratricopeptide repeat protein [Methylophilus aquaticus]MDP8566650.1 tetratricopeptide repeat protein [Methylophilus aquaticus]
MSLINQVLQDVEKRQAGDAHASWAGQVRPVLQVSAADTGRNWLKYSLWLLLLVGMGYLIVHTRTDWLQWLIRWNAPEQRSSPIAALPGVNMKGASPQAAPAGAVNPPAQSVHLWDGLARSLSGNWQSESQPLAKTLPKVATATADALLSPKKISQNTQDVSSAGDAAEVPAASEPVLKGVKPEAITMVASKVTGQTGGQVDKGSVNKQVKPDQEVNVLIQQAVDQEQKGRSSEALALLRQAVAAYPQSEDARQLLASYLFEAKQDAEAVALLRVGLKSYPEQRSLRKSLAKWQLSHGQPEAVLETLKPMLQEAAPDAELNWMLAMANQQSGQHGQALPYFERAITLQPGHAQWYVAYALSLRAAGQANQALQQLQMAQNLPLSERMSEFVTQQIRQLSGGRAEMQ